MNSFLSYIFLITFKAQFILAVHEKEVAEGLEAKPGQFPYAAQVSVCCSQHLYCVWGGASLISPSWILTAGRLFPSDNKMLKAIEGNGNAVVYMGSLLYYVSGAHNRTIVKIKRHAKYNRSTLENDIAVAELNKPYILRDHINVVKLPSVFTRKHRKCTLVGHGLMTNFKGIRVVLRMNPLKYENITLATTAELNNASIPDIYLSYNSNLFSIRKSEFGYITAGDRGGPLVCGGLQFGILSFALEVACSVYINRYVQVNKYINFIIKHVPRAHVRKAITRRVSVKKPHPFGYLKSGAKCYEILLEFLVIQLLLSLSNYLL
ncbi:hypothetical protein ILUMI_00564 [Ignelater luminosus]|uniref:Peptidase S1 domain-containing protein n=1 Tax=Ignelater luminosus TaxID=2038154 RepID=A0A8K0DLD1_IGNLU|nr:hypothetical protein ILUMI_00564 [Ignelater luminosus]